MKDDFKIPSDLLKMLEAYNNEVNFLQIVVSVSGGKGRTPEQEDDTEQKA
jgi:hypothetical protein